MCLSIIYFNVLVIDVQLHKRLLKCYVLNVIYVQVPPRVLGQCKNNNKNLNDVEVCEHVLKLKCVRHVKDVRVESRFSFSW